MVSEIGSEFWDISISGDNGLFPASTQWFLSGRSALQEIIRQSKITSVALPSWCCDSMIVPFLREHIKVSFYPVYVDRGFKQDLSQVDADGILILDYFGYTDQTDVSGFSGKVIRDVTHSLFSKTYNDADYYFGSLRKWAGFWTGGFAWGIDGKTLPENVSYADLRKSAMEQKQRYITGESDSKDYLTVYSQAEELLERYEPAGASARDVRLAQILDVDFIKQRRRANAKVLLEAVGDIALFPNPAEQDCPMFVPIFVPDGKRDLLRRYLIDNAIYCPVHWPVSEYHVLDEKTGELYQNSLSLVCDQRYTEADMQRLVETIKNFWKE